jgi:hypothetical protein
MYYDLIASLPYLPHFERADRLPITRLRLEQRLRLLRPAHAEQLARARSLVCWRLDASRWKSDAAQVDAYQALVAAPLDTSLKDYVAFRMDQRTLVAASRRKRDGLESLEQAGLWGAGPWVRHVQMHWDEPDFGLGHLFPWLPPARDSLAAGDARGLERLLMDVAWRRLNRHAERDTFSFEAVFAYFFKWDILQAWLASDAVVDRVADAMRDVTFEIIATNVSKEQEQQLREAFGQD